MRSEDMDLRDWFAGMALQGIFAGGYRSERITEMAQGILGGAVPAQAAYVLADAMLTEQAKYAQSQSNSDRIFRLQRLRNIADKIISKAKQDIS